MTKGNVRLPHESRKNYKKRLHGEKHLIRGYLRGRYIWRSPNKGQYIRAEHGEIRSDRVGGTCV